MKNLKIFIFVFVAFLLISVCSIYAIAGNKNIDKENSEEDESELKECAVNSECVDEDLCTVHYCEDDMCMTGDVVLCYQSDGCCPSGCTPENDNDCT